MAYLFDYLNWPAIAVASLAYFLLGALWYSKILFAKRWISDLKLDINDPTAKKGIGLMFGGSLLMMFVQTLLLAILAERLGLSGACWLSGLKLGAFLGAGYAATIGINYFYEKKPLSLFFINSGYAIAGNVVAGIIICCWG